LTAEGLLSIVGFFNKESGVMAKAEPKTPEKKPKRRLRSAPTLREQTEGQSTKVEKPALVKRLWRTRLFSPVRAFGRLIKAIALFIAKGPIGSLVKAIALSKPLWPIRFLLKILSKILLLGYFRNAWKELKLVVWPNARTTWRLTFAVLMFGIIFGLVIAGLDWVFERVFREIILDL